MFENWRTVQVNVQAILEKEAGKLLEADHRDLAWWRKNVEIEPDVDLVSEEAGDSISLDFKWIEWVTLWGKDDNETFDWESEQSQIGKSSIYDMDKTIEDYFGYNKENILKLRSEAVLRLNVLCSLFSEVVGTSF